MTILKSLLELIINHCISNDIGILIVEYNSDFKININLGKATNQQFTQILFGILIEQLENLYIKG